MKWAFTIFMTVAFQALLFGQPIQASADRMKERIEALSQFGANPDGGVDRVAYSDADMAGRKYVVSLMKKAGLEVTIDAAGNIIGKRKGKNNDLPSIAFGSHIDSVPGGGNFDGDVGSLGAIECIELMNEHHIITEHPLEVLVFQNEEGGLVGSEAISGILTENELSLVSNSGKTLGQGMKDIGGDPGRFHEAARKKGDFKAFLELHIEQGGFLDREGVNIGVVEGIVGIKQWMVTFLGKANHAGTTPMDQRQDAMLAAARFVVEANRIARSIPGRQVVTNGKIKALPGAPNVIPGKVEMTLEIRDLDFEKVLSIFEKIKTAAKDIATGTGVAISYAELNEDIPAQTDSRIQSLIAGSAKELGLTTKFMPSGAGHDTQNMARIAPVGMVFVPSKDGISHSPKEFTSAQDMANGASVLLQTILKLDKVKL
ncbi:MAG: Zn-dependent hydrolase [Cyclobacteriaceae bacterium]|nr:Zn-dependent hydrolase [Cyclobacteriaceae bacterium]MCB0500888.1 Zn-dependent hydrolase [Cyclobacteriaceae bacterium]MCB9237855.1 Zn-dependent hydrolase [Flammeovirgaceae bacterium]MCO5270043.1 Zn-dependent hydrolase [Cyclobacteriaceae bacterium]MCW5902539.1 Zn-dependent hydrolase [Cyclobacteriaceae bacterium]